VKLIKWLKFKYSKVKTFVRGNLTDVLIFLALFIIAINSILINFNYGMYILAGELILVAYSLYRKGGE